MQNCSKSFANKDRLISKINLFAENEKA